MLLLFYPKIHFVFLCGCGTKRLDKVYSCRARSSSRDAFEQLSGGRVRLAAGTLYGALNSLCEKGWIRQLPMESGSRKKEYQLTAEGLAVLKHELARLQQLVANGESILKEE